MAEDNYFLTITYHSASIGTAPNVPTSVFTGSHQLVGMECSNPFITDRHIQLYDGSVSTITAAGVGTNIVQSYLIPAASTAGTVIGATAKALAPAEIAFPNGLTIYVATTSDGTAVGNTSCNINLLYR